MSFTENHLNLTGLSKISGSKRYSNLRLTMENWSAILLIDEVVLLDLSMGQSWAKTRAFGPFLPGMNIKNIWHHKLCPLSHEADIINPSIRKDDATHILSIHLYPRWWCHLASTGSLGSSNRLTRPAWRRERHSGEGLCFVGVAGHDIGGCTWIQQWMIVMDDAGQGMMRDGLKINHFSKCSGAFPPNIRVQCKWVWNQGGWPLFPGYKLGRKGHQQIPGEVYICSSPRTNLEWRYHNKLVEEVHSKTNGRSLNGIHTPQISATNLFPCFEDPPKTPLPASPVNQRKRHS